jgi:hypothetical protein
MFKASKANRFWSLFSFIVLCIGYVLNQFQNNTSSQITFVVQGSPKQVFYQHIGSP